MNSSQFVVLLGWFCFAATPGGTCVANHCGEPPDREPREIVLVPASTWTRISNSIELPAIKGGHDHYLVSLSQGCTYTFSLCSHGGSTSFDSGLSIWTEDLSQQLGCDMNSCGINKLGSELTWVAPADGTYHLRIGGFPDTEAHQYTLAYAISEETCGNTSVTATPWTRVKRLYSE